MRLATLNTIRLPNHSLRLMAGILAEQGRDIGAALAAAGVEQAQLSDVRAEVTGAQEVAFQRVFFELTRETPQLWLELGARYRLLSHAHTSYGLTMATSANMQEAVETGLHFGDLHYTLSTGVGIYADSLMTGFFSYNTEVPADLRRFCGLRDVGTICTVFADLWGAPFPFTRVELSLDPADDVLVRPYLQSIPIRYGARRNAWHWQVSLLDRKPPQSDRILHDYYVEQCRAAIDTALEQGDIVSLVTSLVTESSGQLDLAAVAARAGLSVRTLQRKLREEGIGFRDLTALGRHRAACRLLNETRTSITRIALDVGYNNVSSFNHAFRRQAGVSPRAYRRLTPATLPPPASRPPV